MTAAKGTASSAPGIPHNLVHTARLKRIMRGCRGSPSRRERHRQERACPLAPPGLVTVGEAVRHGERSDPVRPALDLELFGHARGAFIGACATPRATFEASKGGTLFLSID